MDIQTNTTTLSRGVATKRDHSAPRRAYLDTYAKRRSVHSAFLPVATETIAPQVQALPYTAPASLSAPLEKEEPELYMEAQPSSESFRYRPAMTDILPKRTYLDTLQVRHNQALGSVPSREAAALASQLDSDTDLTTNQSRTSSSEQKLEANLSALYAGSLTEQIARNTTSASASHIRTIVMSALACGVMAVGIFTFISKYDSAPVVAQPIGSPVIEVESSNVASQPTGTPVAASAATGITANKDQPVKLTISSIGVNTDVQSLGLTSDGLIEVPQAYGVAGWYNKSSTPGKAGPTVLVGHYSGGNGAVFDNLKNLKAGDLITTTNSKGQAVTYKVSVINEYDRDKVPMAEIFKSSKDSRLEIITCAGKWQSNTYNKRLVVSAEIVK